MATSPLTGFYPPIGGGSSTFNGGTVSGATIFESTVEFQDTVTFDVPVVFTDFTVDDLTVNDSITIGSGNNLLSYDSTVPSPLLFKSNKLYTDIDTGLFTLQYLGAAHGGFLFPGVSLIYPAATAGDGCYISLGKGAPGYAQSYGVLNWVQGVDGFGQQNELQLFPEGSNINCGFHIVGDGSFYTNTYSGISGGGLCLNMDGIGNVTVTNGTHNANLTVTGITTITSNAAASGGTREQLKLYYPNGTSIADGTAMLMGLSTSLHGAITWSKTASLASNSVFIIPDYNTNSSYFYVRGDGTFGGYTAGDSFFDVDSLGDVFCKGTFTSSNPQATGDGAIQAMQFYYPAAGNADGISLVMGVSPSDDFGGMIWTHYGGGVPTNTLFLSSDTKTNVYGMTLFGDGSFYTTSAGGSLFSVDADGSITSTVPSSSSGIAPQVNLYNPVVTEDEGIQIVLGVDESLYGAITWVYNPTPSLSYITLVPDYVSNTCGFKISGDGSFSIYNSSTPILIGDSSGNVLVWNDISIQGVVNTYLNVVNSSAGGFGVAYMGNFFATNAITGDIVQISTGAASSECGGLYWTKGASLSSDSILLSSDLYVNLYGITLLGDGSFTSSSSIGQTLSLDASGNLTATGNLSCSTGLFVTNTVAGGYSLLTLGQFFATNTMSGDQSRVIIGVDGGEYGGISWTKGGSTADDNIGITADFSGSAGLKMTSDGRFFFRNGTVDTVSIRSAGNIAIASETTDASIEIFNSQTGGSGILSGVSFYYPNAIASDGCSINLGIGTTEFGGLIWTYSAVSVAQNTIFLSADTYASSSGITLFGDGSFIVLTTGGDVLSLTAAGDLSLSVGNLNFPTDTGGTGDSSAPTLAGYSTTWAPTIAQLTGTSASSISVDKATWSRSANEVSFNLKITMTQGTVAVPESQTFTATLPFTSIMSGINQAGGLACLTGGVLSQSGDIDSVDTESKIVLNIYALAGSGTTTLSAIGSYTVT